MHYSTKTPEKKKKEPKIIPRRVVFLRMYATLSFFVVGFFFVVCFVWSLSILHHMAMAALAAICRGS
jgi:hypothetical protein